MRLTKKVIKEYANTEATEQEKGEGNFFDTLLSKTQADMDIIGADDDNMTKRMKMHMLE